MTRQPIEHENQQFIRRRPTLGRDRQHLVAPLFQKVRALGHLCAEHLVHHQPFRRVQRRDPRQGARRMGIMRDGLLQYLCHDAMLSQPRRPMHPENAPRLAYPFSGPIQL